MADIHISLTNSPLTLGRSALRRFVYSLLCVAGVTTSCTSIFAVPAGESVSNLTSTANTNWGANPLPNPTFAAFTTGSDATALRDVILNLSPILNYADNSWESTATYQLSLWSNDAGSPGTELFTIGTVNNPATDHTLLTFTDTSNDSLAAATTYWLALNITGPNEEDGGTWNATSVANTVTGTAGWNILPGGEAFNFPQSSPTPLFEVDAGPASVPEPTGLALLGLASCMFAMRRKRKA